MTVLKKNKTLTLIFVFIAALACALSAFGVFGTERKTASAVGGQYLFDRDGSDYVVTRVSDSAEIYRGVFSGTLISSAISSAEGDTNYTIKINAPTLTVVRTSENATEGYDDDVNKFSFYAEVSHPLSALGGFSAPDSASGYVWSATPAGGSAVQMDVRSHTAVFGAGRSPGSYEVKAEAEVAFEFNGKRATASASDTETVSVVKGNSPVSGDYFTLYYGESLSAVLRINGSGIGGRWSFDPSVDTTLIPSVGNSSYPAVFEKGSWSGDVFTADENYLPTAVDFRIKVERRLVRVLLEPAEMIQGDEFPTCNYSLVGSDTLPGGKTLADIGVELYAADDSGAVQDGSQSGHFTLYGRATNANFEVFFVDEDHLDAYSSTGAAFTVYPRYVSVNSSGLTLTAERALGFAFEDTATIFASQTELPLPEYEGEGELYLLLPIGRFVFSGESGEFEAGAGKIFIGRENTRAEFVYYLSNGVWERADFNENGVASFEVSDLGAPFAVMTFYPPEAEETESAFNSDAARVLVIFALWIVAIAAGFAFSLLFKRVEWNTIPDSDGIDADKDEDTSSDSADKDNSDE